MKWKAVKEFLKPTKEKVVLSIILAILLFSIIYRAERDSIRASLGISYEESLYGPCCHLGQPLGYQIQVILGDILIYLTTILDKFYISLPIVFISYVLSCLIVFAYNKLKPRKK